MAPKAKVAVGRHASSISGPRVPSKTFSAAADLVVKPATPPKVLSGVVGNRIAAGTKSKPMAVERNFTEIAISRTTNSATAKIQAEVKEVEEELGPKALLEVRGMSGEVLLKAEFQLSEQVSSVKERIYETRGIPVWQQMLSFQAEMLNDQSRLDELSLPQEDAVFDIVLKSLPSPDEMEALTAFGEEVLADGRKGMEALQRRDVMEVRAFAKPPIICSTVCRATLHLLAGLAPEISIKRNGNPTDESFSGCKTMMGDPNFIKQVLELPSRIDEGRLMEKRVLKCRMLIDEVDGDSESDKIQNTGRCSLMCQQLIRFLIGLVKYYESVAEIRERFGGATVTDLKSFV